MLKSQEGLAKVCWGDCAMIVLWEVHKPKQAITLNSIFPGPTQSSTLGGHSVPGNTHSLPGRFLTSLMWGGRELEDKALSEDMGTWVPSQSGWGPVTRGPGCVASLLWASDSLVAATEEFRQSWSYLHPPLSTLGILRDSLINPCPLYNSVWSSEQSLGCTATHS